MPHWERIEDASSSASRVWLGRRKLEVNASSDGASSCVEPTATSSSSSEEWKPLRKCDCQALNSAQSNKTVFIEGGRATADPINNLIFLNFFNGHQRDLTSAVWFVRHEKSKNEVILDPVSHVQDSEKIEALYQKAVSATSSLGKGIGSVLNDEVTLSDEAKVRVRQTGGCLTMQKTPPGWFSSSLTLQRGYGEYTVEGEEEEAILGPARHLVFVVHGIGETFFSKEDVSIPDLIEMTNTTRLAVQRKQIKDWRKQCDKATRDGQQSLPPPPNRIEFLPVQWFNRLHDSSSELMKTLKGVSLPSIPALRAIANDIIFDVLLYLTPNFAQAVLECVTEQINDLHRIFVKIHPDFVTMGECSLVGHSLGSVILWDILSILKESHQGTRDSLFRGVTFDDSEFGYHAYTAKEVDNEAKHGSWGPSLTTGIQQTIPFTPKTTIFLGSPLGMFLTLRGAHAVFDAMRKQATNPPTVSPFTLPTGSLYNIFNPSDPVAYRIEPLLLSQDTKPSSIPPPRYLTAPGKDVRFHLKAKQLGEDIRKSVMEQKETIGTLLGSAVSSLAAYAEAIQKENQNNDDTTGSTPTLSANASNKKQQQDEEVLVFPLGGNSTRVDYSLQPGVIDSEYISAVLAHSGSSYFLNEDLMGFMIDQFAGRR